VAPRMFIVAGPPGGGKSTAFPVSGFGVDFFNADDRAAALNEGSYLNILRTVRAAMSIRSSNRLCWITSRGDRVAHLKPHSEAESHLTRRRGLARPDS